MSNRSVSAVILCFGACLLLAALPARPQSVAATRQEGVVPAAAFYKSSTGCGGTTFPVYIRIEPNTRRSIEVGFFESSADALGPQWRTAGWMAALMATDLLDQELNAHRISYTVAGLVDGPSAGALMTTGLLALMRGEKILDHVSMTGTINPDGTIGPVGGIAFKIRGVDEANKTRFAIPLGKRRDTNPCTFNDEDVVAIGRSLGVEVVEVGDIREAYAFLTGSTLPVAPIQPVSTQIPAELRADFRRLFEHWQARYEATHGVVAGAQQAEFPPVFQSLWSLGTRLARTGQDELATGHEPAAFNRIWMAVLNAEFVARGVQGMRILQARQLPGLHDFVQHQLARVQQHVATNLSAFQGLSVDSIVDAGAMALIGANLATAQAYFEQAQAELRQSIDRSRSPGPKDYAQMIRRAFEALAHISVTGPLVDVAVVSKGWLGRGGPSVPKRTKRITLSMLNLYRSAARSNLAYVDALHTAGEARRKKVSMETAQDEQRRVDPIYLAARGTFEQHWNLPELFGEGLAATFAQLGALLRTLTNSSLLVAQHYSLGAQMDEFGRVVGFRYEAALKRMTELAEQEALRALGEANAATGGASTPMLIVGLDAARRNRDVSVTAQDRLTALGLFWDATLTARLIAKLARYR